ncbi:MAG: class I SAM-dependent methyltransferase [Candidatus Thorarchaeota archaeon]
MAKKDQHYYTESPDVEVKIHTIPLSLRKHLYIFKTTPGVFSFKKLDLGTRVLLENIIFPENQETFLDLGCGYGIIGIVIATELEQSNTYFIDSNKRAIWCTWENIKTNLPDQMKRLKVLYGSYFEPFYENKITFDGIYMNPPMRKGRREFLKLCQTVPNFLNVGGFFQFVIKKKMGAEYILKYFQERISNNHIEVICKRSGYWVFNYIKTQ